MRGASPSMPSSTNGRRARDKGLILKLKGTFYFLKLLGPCESAVCSFVIGVQSSAGDEELLPWWSTPALVEHSHLGGHSCLVVNTIPGKHLRSAL